MRLIAAKQLAAKIIKSTSCIQQIAVTLQKVVSNSYTMHAKAALVLSARAQGRSPRARADKN